MKEKSTPKEQFKDLADFWPKRVGARRRESKDEKIARLENENKLLRIENKTLRIQAAIFPNVVKIQELKIEVEECRKELLGVWK